MSLVKAQESQQYVETPIHRPTKGGIRIISEMSTLRIVWFLMNRHRVGLWALTAMSAMSYIAYDKFLHIFI